MSRYFRALQRPHLPCSLLSPRGRMEMNQDVDSLLLAQFSSMATQDREVLISELQKVIGNQLNAEQCAFFLDMNNW